VIRNLLLLAAALALAACSSGATQTGESSGGARVVQDPATTPTASAPTTAAPGATAPAAAAGPEFPAPASLAEGDRWFVAVKPTQGPRPSAERRRLRNVDGVLREEVTWGTSFADVAAASHGMAQVFAVSLDGRGVSVALLDEAGKVVGRPAVEVATPFRAGTRWLVEPPSGAPLWCEIEAIEEVETPSGKVQALRVAVRSPSGRPSTMTTWYDAGLRPVRAELRSFGSRELIEARAALASATPTPEECRAAFEWAEKNLAK